MRLPTAEEAVHFCFFYSPEAHHPLPIRSKFYDIFTSKFSKFAFKGTVYLLGDTNARLGSLLDDKNIHGEHVTNSNSSLFNQFLEFSGLPILNRIFCLGVPTFEIINRKSSIIDMCLTNSLASVVNFEIKQTPLGANSQTCHKPLILSISLYPRNVSINLRVKPKKRIGFGSASLKKRKQMTKFITSRLSFFSDCDISLDYEHLKSVFLTAKNKFLFHAKMKKKPRISCATLLLQRQFRDAMKNMLRDKSDYSVFVAGHLEKLLHAQHRKESTFKFNKWLAKMNNLDFQKRTRSFFVELRRKYRTAELVGPIENSSGTLSRNLSETLKNWSNFYSKLYAEVPMHFEKHTPDDDPDLDQDLTLSEFLDSVYDLKSHKAPGADHITTEDIKSLIPHEDEEEQIDPDSQLSSLHFIFRMLSDFWFNECVPQDFKRTILRPFLKDHSKSIHDPSNYRPISLLNTPMKIYEAIICRRLDLYLESKNTLSAFQAAYRRRKSTVDHILILHEIFLEYRYNKIGPRGGHTKKRLILVFLDLKKAFDTVPRDLLFLKILNSGIRGKLFRVIRNLFSSNPANVLVDGFLSPEFYINRGVLQGSKLGPLLFNLFINDLLDSLNNSNLGATIGDIRVSALGFADDIVLVTDCPKKAQKLLDICQTWAKANMMAFKTSKCKVMVLNGPSRDVHLQLYSDILKIVDTHKYLGVTFTSKYITNLFKVHFSLLLEKARIRVSTIRRYGFHKDGLRLATAIRLYKLYVRPILDFCAQTLTYTSIVKTLH